MTQHKQASQDSGTPQAPKPSQETPSRERHGPASTWQGLVSDSSDSSFGVQQAIGRAITDPQFRERLFERPDDALAGFQLTSQESQWLHVLDRQLFDSVLEGLKLELAGFITQALQEEKRIVKLANEWGAQIDAIGLDLDRPPDTSNEGTESQE
jgi:hypothetical protein